MNTLRRKDKEAAAAKLAAEANAAEAKASEATPTTSLSELPPPPSFCSSCGDVAGLSYKCGGCQLVNYYCNKYSCQTDHWTKHLDDCEQLLDQQQDETTITRLKDGSSWARKRRRNIKRDVNLDLQLERLPVLDIHSKQIVGTTLEGWLAHPGDANRHWHLRYFVLKDDILFCFPNEDSTARGAVSLLGFKVRAADEELKEKCGIKAYHADGRTHFFVASDKDEASKWIKVLAKAAAPRWGVTIQRGQSASELGSSFGGTVAGMDDDDQAAKGVVAQADVRSLLLRADISDPSKGDKLVNVRLTFYLSEPASEGSSYDTLSRQSAVARVMSMPPPYDRDQIRQEATEMGDAEAFAKKSRWSFSSTRKKSVRGIGSLGSSMPQLNRAGSVNSVRSIDGSGEVSPKSRTRMSLFELHNGERAASLDESRGRNGSNSSLTESTGGSPRLRDGSPTSTMHLASSQPSLAALHVRSSSRAAPGADWGGVAQPPGAVLNTGRRRSIVSMDAGGGSAVAAAAAAAAAAQFQQQLLQQSLLHGRDRSGSETSSMDGNLPGVNSDSASFDMNTMFQEGWLMRVDGPGEPTRLWFVLDDFYLSAFPTDDSTQCLLEIDLEGCEYMPHGEDGFIVRQGNNMLHAQAADGVERDRWLRVMDSMRDYFIDEAARGAAGASSADDSVQQTPDSGSVPPTPRAPKSATDEDEEEEDAGDDEGFSLAQAVSTQSPRTIRGLTPALDTTEADAASDRQKKGEDEFTQALERAAADLQQIQLSPTEEVSSATIPAPQTPRAATEAGAESSPSQQLLLPPSAAGLPALPTYTKPLESPADIKAAQAEAAKRKMSYLFPPKSPHVDLAKGAIAPPTEGKVLDMEEMKKFAVHDGIDKDDEDKAVPGTVMLAQDSDDIIVQFHMDDGGKVDEYNITAGTLDVLISRLADESHPDTVYIDIFLLSYRHVISSSALMDRLFARFNVHPPPCATPEQLAYYNQWASVIQVRTIGVIKKWIDNYWGDFVSDEAALECLMEFLEFTERSSSLMAGLVERLRRIVSEKQEATRAAEVFNAVKETPKPIKMDFTQFEPREFARQLALADHALFVAIAPVEFVIRLWEGNGPQTRNLTEMIDWFNRISFFTATTIVVQPILKKRAQIVENYIKVLKESYRIHNFNGMMAILSGLNNASVRRLKKTWALVGAKHLETLRQMEELMASAFNYRTYRGLVSQIDKEPRPGPLVPFMGLFLRDLTFLNDGNPKKFKGNLVNMGKLRMVAQRILRLQVYQMSRYNFPTTRASSTIKEFLKAPYAMTDENALYACSLQCEPRDNK